MPVWVGIDWSETYQDWAAVDSDGSRIGGGRLLETVEDVDAFDAQLQQWRDPDTEALPSVTIETNKGLLVAELRKRGYTVYDVNPLKVARYRDRYEVSRGKSDYKDAVLIANILRTDPGVHRPMHDTSDLGRSIATLSRAHQDTVWRVNQVAAEVRSLLRQYFPAALVAYPAPKLPTREARIVLSAAPTPTLAAKLTTRQLQSLLRKAGRVKYIDRDAKRRQDLFRAPALHHEPASEHGFGLALKALLRTLDGAVEAQQELERDLIAVASTHPFWEQLLVIVGVGEVTAARIIGEVGDDTNRFETLDNIRAFSGTSPITRASGKSHWVAHRQVKNNRFASTMHMWAQTAMAKTPGGRAHYDHRRAVGDKHAAALRNMSNRLIGCLWHCLTTGEVWDENKVWGHRYAAAIAAAATVPQTPVDTDEVADETNELNETELAQAAALLADGHGEDIPTENVEALAG